MRLFVCWASQHLLRLLSLKVILRLPFLEAHKSRLQLLLAASWMSLEEVFGQPVLEKYTSNWPCHFHISYLTPEVLMSSVFHDRRISLLCGSPDKNSHRQCLVFFLALTAVKNLLSTLMTINSQVSKVIEMGPWKPHLTTITSPLDLPQPHAWTK